MLELLVRENDRSVCETALAAPLEIGRRRSDEAARALFALLPAVVGPARLLTAPNEEKNIGRQHVLLEPLPGGIVGVSNRIGAPLPCQDGPDLAAGASADLTPPF